MRKLLCSLLVVGLGLGLVACGDKGGTTNPDPTTINTTTEESKVKVPQDLSFDNSTGKVTWGAVNKASSYIVSINNVEYNVDSKTEYVIDLTANAGEYLDIKVLAISNNVNLANSDYSEVLSIVIPGGMDDAKALSEVKEVVGDDTLAQSILQIAKNNKVSNKNISSLVQLTFDASSISDYSEIFEQLVPALNEVSCSDQQAIGFVVDLIGEITLDDSISQFLAANKADLVEGLSAYYAIAKFLNSQEATNFVAKVMAMSMTGVTTTEVMTLRDSLIDYVDRLLPTTESVNKLVNVVKNGLDAFKGELKLDDETVVAYKKQLDFMAQEIDLALMSVRVMLNDVTPGFVDALLAVDPSKYVIEVIDDYQYDYETGISTPITHQESAAQYAYASAAMLYVESLLSDPAFNRLMDKSVELEYNNIDMAFITAESTGNVSFDEINMEKLIEILKGNVTLNNFLGLSKAYRKVVLALSKSEVLRDPEKFVLIGSTYSGEWIYYKDDADEFLASAKLIKYMFNLMGIAAETAEKDGLKETINVVLNFLNVYANNLEALGCPAENLNEIKAQLDAIIDMITKLKDVAPDLALELAAAPKLISDNIDLDKELQNFKAGEKEGIYYGSNETLRNALEAAGYASSSSPKVKAMIDKVVATGVIDADTLNAMVDELLGAEEDKPAQPAQ